MKRIKFIAIFIFVMSLMILTSASVQAITVDTVTSSMLIDAGYGWSFEYVNGTTTSEAGGMTNYDVDYLVNNSQNNNAGEKSVTYSARLTKNSQKGNIWVLYKNVGSYEGQAVDLKITVMDWDYLQPANTNALSVTGGVNYPTIFFRKNEINVYMTSYPAVAGVEFKYEFFKHNTSTKIDVKGHINFKDIDSGEYIDAISGLDKMYISSSSNLDKKTDGVQCPYLVSSANNDKNHWTTVLFSGTEFSFVYSRLQDQKGNSYRDVSSTTTTRSTYHYVITGDSLTPIDIKSPSKSVNKTEITGTDQVVYTITHHVASESSDFYYDNYTITDNIPKCFTVGSIKVYDNFGQTELAGLILAQIVIIK